MTQILKDSLENILIQSIKNAITETNHAYEKAQFQYHFNEIQKICKDLENIEMRAKKYLKELYKETPQPTISYIVTSQVRGMLEEILNEYYNQKSEKEFNEWKLEIEKHKKENDYGYDFYSVN
jgi:hypothetical protein